MEQVPTLKIDGLLLTQSVAIMEYLADKHPDAGLLPKDLVSRVRVRQVTEIICSGIQPVQNLSVLQRRSSEPAVRSEWARHFITSGFVALEQLLATTAGTCCVGNCHRHRHRHRHHGRLLSGPPGLQRPPLLCRPLRLPHHQEDRGESG